MTWYAPDGSDPILFRVPVRVDATGDTGTVEVDFTVSTTFTHFFDHVDIQNLRVADADGVTSLDWDTGNFSPTVKTAEIEVQNWTLNKDNAVNFFWIYYGGEAANREDGTFSPSTPITDAECVLQCPTGIVFDAARQGPGDTAPKLEVQKSAADVLDVWFDVTGLLQKRCRAFNGSLDYETVSWLDARVLSGGSDQSGLRDADKSYMVELGGRTYVSTRVKAGSSGTDYTISLLMGTSLDRIYDLRALLKVQDLLNT